MAGSHFGGFSSGWGAVTRGAVTRAQCRLGVEGRGPVSLFAWTLCPCAPPSLCLCTLHPCALHPCTLHPCTLHPCTLHPCAPAPCTPAPLTPAPLYSCTLHPMPLHSCTLHPCTPVSCTLVPLHPCTLAPVPLHPASLHPVPYVLHLWASSPLLLGLPTEHLEMGGTRVVLGPGTHRDPAALSWWCELLLS